LYYSLKQHPDVYLAPTTELNFFAHAGGDLNFGGPGDLKDLWEDSLLTTCEAYEKQFAGVDRETPIVNSPPTISVPPKPLP
jgi:hypothetical protein